VNTFLAISLALSLGLAAIPVVLIVGLLGLRLIARRRLARRKHAGLRILR
jgi:hypothetical protein